MLFHALSFLSPAHILSGSARGGTHRRITILAVFLCAAVGAAPRILAQANVTGQWVTLPYLMPINPIRVALLHNGKVLIVAGSENDPNKHQQFSSKAALWNLGSSAFTILNLPWDVFCNGGSLLADGRCVVVGGTVQYDPFYGDPRMTVYDPLFGPAGRFYQLHSMAHGRWYASAITLSDGRVLAFSGLDESGKTNSTIEMYKVASGWSAPNQAPFTPPLYPWLHLLPDGTVFYSGCTPQSYIFNPSTQTWTASAPTHYGLNRPYGNSVLLSLLPATNYAARIMILGGGTGTVATATTEIIDLSQPNPKWVASANMSSARVEGNSVLLPNGKVLALGGSPQNEVANTASLAADLYDPTSGTFSSAGTCVYARLYHSVALLLPDATVLSAGSNPKRGTYEQHIEIYSPAYLFTTDPSGKVIPAPRPAIASIAPTVIGYGSTGTFTVTLSASDKISSVVLARPGSVTHAFDMDQRVVGLSFTQNGATLTVNLPPNANLAPPGYYMLFVLNSAGVPSVAKFLQVSPFPTDKPPKGTMTAPTTVVNIQAGQSVIFNGTASDSDGTVATTSWYFPSGTPKTSSVFNPGAVMFASAGTFTCSFTVVDNLGENDPSPPFHTIIVSPAVTISNPTAGSSVTGTVQIQSQVAGTTGSSNTFTFTLDSTVLSTQKVSGNGANLTWNTQQASKGAHTLSVKVQDEDGHLGSTTESVTVY
jgi:Domain of unknown function (DUF1929)/Glyoxal oxidase N-terminus/Bacterial Ig domain/PKD domain